MTELSIYDFVEARLDETEYYIQSQLRGHMIPIGAEIQAMFHVARIVLKMHKQWPTMVHGPMEIEPERTDIPLNAVAFRMKQNIDFLIHEEYVERFGEEPPTTKMLRQYAAIWSNHPDFNPEWFEGSLADAADMFTKNRVISPDEARKLFGMPPRE